jgi:hypothetical protein
VGRGIEELAYGAVVEIIGVVEGPVVRGAVTEMLDSLDGRTYVVELTYGAVVEIIGVVEGPVVRGAVTEMLDSLDGRT